MTGFHGIRRAVYLGIVGILMLMVVGCQSAKMGDAGVTHLTLWHGVNPPPNRDVLQHLVDQFNRTHSTIEVESLYVGQGDQQMPKILASVVGGVPPNLLWYAPMITGQLIELEAICPLDDWLATSPAAAELDPNLRESMTWEGQIWSVPFGVNTVGLFYRPSLFEAAGVTELPQSWADLREVARTLTQLDAEPPQYGLLLPLGKGEWTVFMWLSFLWSAGGEILSEDSGQPNVIHPGAIAALQFWRDLIEDGSVLLSQPERGYELNDFLESRVAMQLTGPWTLRQLRATGVDFAVMPIPADSRPAVAQGGENLFIFKTTPEEELASQVFAEYVISEAFQTEWAMETGYLPVNVRSRESNRYQTYISQNPEVAVFLNQLSYGRSRPVLPGYNRLSNSLGRAIESVLLGQDPPETALKAAQNRLDLVLGSGYTNP
jgi:multiple sugar transport system substrate-binding protein